MIWDIGLLVLSIALALLGFRLGFRGNLVATLGLVAAVAAGIVLQAREVGSDGPAILPLAIGAWAIVHLAACAVRARWGRGRSFFGGTLGLVQAGAIAVVAAGTMGAAGSDAMMTSAWTYPPIASAGDRLGAAVPEAGLAYPKPALEPARSASATPTRPIAWSEAVLQDGTVTRILNGTVRAAERAPLSFEVDGRVAEIAVSIGDAFQADDVLAILDTTALEIALEERRAALIEAEAGRTEAEQDHARQATLHARGVVAEAALESARARLDSARSRVAVSRAAIASAQERLADARLIAPYDGRVAARLIEPAETIRPSEPAFEVQSASGGFEIGITVPESLVAELELGEMHPAAILDGHGTQLRAELTEIGARTDGATGFPVTLTLRGAPQEIRAGLTAEVRLTLRGVRPSGVAVPLAAVAMGDGSDRHVFTYDGAAGTLARREVVLSDIEGELALLSAGLDAGEIVATAGLPFLSDGMPVALMGVGVARFDR